MDAAEAATLYQRDGCALKTSTPVRLEQPATIAPGRYSRRSLDSRSNPQPDCPACGACNDYTKILYASGFARREVNFYCKVCQLCWRVGSALSVVQPSLAKRGTGKRSFQSAVAEAPDVGCAAAVPYAPLATHPHKALFTLPTIADSGSAESSMATNSITHLASGSDNALASACLSASSAGVRSWDAGPDATFGAAHRGSSEAGVRCPDGDAQLVFATLRSQNSDMQTGSNESNGVAGPRNARFAAPAGTTQQTTEMGGNGHAQVPVSVRNAMRQGPRAVLPDPALARRGHTAAVVDAQSQQALPAPAQPPAWQYRGQTSRAVVSDSHVYRHSSSTSTTFLDSFATASMRTGFVESALAPPTWARPQGPCGRATASASYAELRMPSMSVGAATSDAAALLGLPLQDGVPVPYAVGPAPTEWRGGAGFGAPSWATPGSRR